MRKYEPYAYTLLRFAAGMLLFFYGTGRLLDWPRSVSSNRYETFLVGPIELVGGLCVAIGLFTRPSAFLCAAAMAGIYLVHNHADFRLPIVSGSDATVLFFCAFVYIVCKGEGRLSLDSERRSDRND